MVCDAYYVVANWKPLQVKLESICTRDLSLLLFSAVWLRFHVAL